MDSLSDDLLPELLAALGNSAMSYASSVQFSATNTAFHSTGALLPCKGGACTLNIDHLVNIMPLTRQYSWDVYDVTSRRIVTVSYDARMCKFTFPNKPINSARWLEADHRLIWFKDNVRLSLSNIDMDENRELVEKLVARPLSSFKLSKAEKASASGECREKLLPRGGAGKYEYSTKAKLAIDRIAEDMLQPMNTNITALKLTQTKWSCIADTRFDRLITDQLTHLSIHNIHLTISAVRLLLLAADRLHMLDLSGSLLLDMMCCTDFGLLLQRWRADESVTPIRKLILDGVSGLDKCVISLATIIYGACMPENESFEVVDAHSQITQGTPQVYISCFPCSPRQWGEAIASAMLLPPLKLPKVCTKMREVGRDADAPAKKRKTMPASCPTLSVENPAETAAPAPRYTAASREYTNSMRERDRYMIQWFDYKCKNCGGVWQADCVTISYRQTAVSQCLKNHKKCVDRDEYTRMMNGERYITTKHMSGNGGTDLTPSAMLIREAKRQGLLLAIDPDSKRVVGFKPHSDKPPPAKVEVPDEALPAWLTGNVTADKALEALQAEKMR